MATNPSGAAGQEAVGGFITDPAGAAQAPQGGCCGEPADSTGAVVGGQGGGCCGEPAVSALPVVENQGGCCGSSGGGCGC